MSLQDKYASLISAAKQNGTDIKVVEQDNVLYIDGHVGSAAQKDALWKIYNELDPDYRAGDVRLNIEVAATDTSMQEYIVKKGDNLSKIASHYGITWKDIFEANKDKIKNPDLIQPGWKLKIPSKA